LDKKPGDEKAGKDGDGILCRGKKRGERSRIPHLQKGGKEGVSDLERRIERIQTSSTGKVHFGEKNNHRVFTSQRSRLPEVAWGRAPRREKQ